MINSGRSQVAGHVRSQCSVLYTRPGLQSSPEIKFVMPIADLDRISTESSAALCLFVLAHHKGRRQSIITTRRCVISCLVLLLRSKEVVVEL